MGQMEKSNRPGFSRRAVMKGAAAAAGGLVLGTAFPMPRAQAAGQLAEGVYSPNVFLRISRDSSVTVICKHFEMGQGVVTGLATLVAEELDARWPQMRCEFAAVDPSIYNNLFFGPNQATGASTSIANAWEQMRKVGAAAKAMLVEAAADRWRVVPSEITVEEGRIYHGPSGRTLEFGDVAEAAMRKPVPLSIQLKSPDGWKLIGRALPRLDGLEKTTGRAVYALDVSRPGMLTALIARPKAFGAKLASFDAGKALAVPGVVAVVPISNGVAVIARDSWAAIKGREALTVTWDTSTAESRSTDEFYKEYHGLAQVPGMPVARRGDAQTALTVASRTIDAEFTFPYLAHAPMEPLNAVIEVRGNTAEVWSGCQLPSIDRSVIARSLGMEPGNIRINTVFGGGSFGRRGSVVGDWARELAEVARAASRPEPIRVLWLREDDLQGGYFRPLVLHKVRAGIDHSGRLVAWQHRVVCQSTFAGSPIERSFVKDGIDRSSIEGIQEMPYAVDNLDLDIHQPRSPVPLLWWRSVGHSHTAHVIETVTDELAHLAGEDPVAFRLKHMIPGAREAAVLQLAATKANWGAPLPNGRGRGVAVHQSYQTCVAMVAEVEVNGSTVKILKITAAADCGIAVNPDIVVAQVEGSIGFALASVLREEITLTGGVVDQQNFHDYEPTRMREMPEVEVHIVPSAANPTGIGEPAVPPIAPAIGNAVFAATGRRLRSLPFKEVNG